MLEGFPNGIKKDVYLDGVPIQNPNGTNNFEGFTLASRLGSDETQTPISGFSATENTVGVNVNVTKASGAITRAITDTDTERCRVIIALPALQAQNQRTETFLAQAFGLGLKLIQMAAVIPLSPRQLLAGNQTVNFNALMSSPYLGAALGT